MGWWVRWEWKMEGGGVGEVRLTVEAEKDDGMGMFGVAMYVEDR